MIAAKASKFTFVCSLLCAVWLVKINLTETIWRVDESYVIANFARYY